MMNNIENDIKTAFENHDIKLKAVDILATARPKKKHFFDFLNKPIFKYGFSGAAICTAALMVAFVPNYKTREAMIKDELYSRDFYNSIIGASNSLTYDKEINKKPEEVGQLVYKEAKTTDFEKTAINDVFNDLQGSALVSFNKHKNSVYYQPKENTINNVTYDYEGVLNENVYGSNYKFYFKIDAKELSLDGIITTADSIIKGITFSYIQVDGKLSIDYKNTYFDLTFTPLLFNQDIIGQFNIKEERDGSTTWKYIYKENEVSTFNIKCNEKTMRVIYANEMTENAHVILDFTKISEYNYTCSYTYKEYKGTFQVQFSEDTYDYLLQFEENTNK